MATKPKSVLDRPKFDQDQLVALLPALLGEWKLTGMSLPKESLITGPRASLEASYERSGQTVEVALQNVFPGSASVGEPTVQHSRDESRQENDAVLRLHNGLTIVVSSRSADAATLAAFVNSIDLARAKKLKAVPTK